MVQDQPTFFWLLRLYVYTDESIEWIVLCAGVLSFYPAACREYEAYNITISMDTYLSVLVFCYVHVHVFCMRLGMCEWCMCQHMCMCECVCVCVRVWWVEYEMFVYVLAAKP